MNDVYRNRLRLATIVYWILLSYIIAALVWWFFSLYKQNEMMYTMRAGSIASSTSSPSELKSELIRIDDLRKRNVSKYIGEGGTFLLLIIIGAVYLYRFVRTQFRAQQQQQNFMMAITHELKTPLSVARLNLETIQRHHLEESKKEKLLQMTLKETLRLDDLINNILVSSQLEGNLYRLVKEEFSLSDLTNDVASQFVQRYPERKLYMNILPDIDMNGDPLLIKLLISNLLENANKYSPRESSITLALKKDPSKIQLSVADEGQGISDREKKNVFKKFYRIGNEFTRKAKGTGLGLFLCKKIAKDHQGSIHIEDNTPQGSIFVVHFPFANV